MKKILFTAIGVLSMLQFAFSQTIVSGGIYTNTTWTLANSPYLMTGNIVVFPGVTLNIEPGVEVRVKENGMTGGQYYFETRGTVNMIGQPGSLITFRADAAVTTIAAWVGFVVKNSQGGVLNYDYVSISNAGTAVSYDSWIPQSINLHQCGFNYNTYAINVGTELIAEDCSFTGNQVGLYGWSLFTLKNCVFNNNTAAMSVYASLLNMNNCTFTNNAMGISLNSGSTNGLFIKNTLFENNSVALDNPNNGTVDSCAFIGNVEGIKNSVYLNVKNSNFNNNGTALQIGFGTSVNDCYIEQNETGIALGPIGFGQPMPIVENNRICYNSTYNIDNRTDLNIYIPTNCFCSTDSTEVEDKIFDGYDDISKGLISYAIFDTTCTNVLGIVYKEGGLPTGFDEGKNQNATNVFPNPFSENINIDNKSAYRYYRILSLQGQILQTGTITEGNNSIEASQIPAGTYFLGLYDDDRSSDFIVIVHQ